MRFGSLVLQGTARFTAGGREQNFYYVRSSPVITAKP